MYVITDTTGAHLGGGQTREQVKRELHRLDAWRPGEPLPPLPRFGRSLYLVQPIAYGRRTVVVTNR